MADEKEIRRNAQAFVQKALEDAQGKQPTKKEVKRAVDQIVQNLAPLAVGDADRQQKTVMVD